MIQRIVFIALLTLLCISLLAGTGCEGASKRDREVRAKLEEKLKEWNENGTFPIPEENVETTGNLKEWYFKYNNLYLIFDSTKAHPVTSRGVMEIIAVEWHNLYPENLKPRFILEVYAFKDVKASDSEWGKCKIKKDGSAEVHWYATDVY